MSGCWSEVLRFWTSWEKRWWWWGCQVPQSSPAFLKWLIVSMGFSQRSGWLTTWGFRDSRMCVVRHAAPIHIWDSESWHGPTEKTRFHSAWYWKHEHLASEFIYLTTKTRSERKILHLCTVMAVNAAYIGCVLHIAAFVCMTTVAMRKTCQDI